MKYILLFALSGVVIAACSPEATFSNQDAHLKSLLDGETVQVVEDDTDDGLNGDNSTDTDDDGAAGHPRPPRTGDDGLGGMWTRDDGKHSGRGGSCSKRLKEEAKKDRDGLTITPKEVQDSKDIKKIACCSDGRKIAVCQHAAGYSKQRKSLCVDEDDLGNLAKEKSPAFLGKCPSEPVEQSDDEQ